MRSRTQKAHLFSNGLLWLLTGFALAPALLAYQQDQSFETPILIFMSACFILYGSTTEKSGPRSYLLPAACIAGLFALAGYGLKIDKLILVSGVILLSVLLQQTYRINKSTSIFLFLCLLMLVPIPYVLQTSLGVWFAVLEADVFVSLAQAFNVPIIRHGSQVISEGAVATINSDCSGTLLLWPALLGALVAAAKMHASPYKKLAVILFAVPLALLLNVIRLGVVLILHLNSPAGIVDAFHDFLGWFFMPLVWLIPIVLFTPFAVSAPQQKTVIAYQSLMVFSVGILLHFIVSSANAHNNPYTLPDTTFPYYINGWVGEDMDIPTEEVRILDADHLFRRIYRHPSGKREMLMTYIRHDNVKKSREHSSKLCFEAMGWVVSDHTKKHLSDTSKIDYFTASNFQFSQGVIEYSSFQNQRKKSSAIRIQFVETLDIVADERLGAAENFIQTLATFKGT